MPSEESGSGTSRLGFAVLLLLAVAAAGCAGDDDGQAATTPPADDCSSRAGSDERSSGAQISCLEARGPAVHSVSFECPDPANAGLSLAANLSAGSFTVSLQDAGDERILEETYERDGRFNDSHEIDGGEAGEWTLQVDRAQSFEGGFGVHAACAK